MWEHNAYTTMPIFKTKQQCIDYANGDLDISNAINFQNRKNNYIDTDDEYGWASTADISPSDLAAANPDAAGNLVDKDVTLNSLIAAINALKQKLEEENPNKQTGGVVADRHGNPVLAHHVLLLLAMFCDCG